MRAGAGLLSWCLVLGCRAADELPFDPVEPRPASGGGSAPRASEPTDSDSGASASGQREAPGDAGAPSNPVPSNNEGCRGQPVTLAEVHSGRVRGNVPVALTELVASSQKFLVSEAKSGSCVWGAFSSSRERSGAGSGLLLVSFGAPHETGETCRPGSDGLPDDLLPGDAIEVEGVIDEFAPTACASTAPALQLRVEASCPLRRNGTLPLPDPAVIDPALADRLARGNDATLLHDWGGALVRLEAATAVRDPDDGDAVFPFGVVRLAETSLEVRSRLYYFDLTEGGPRSPEKAPRYPYPMSFPSVTGQLLLDYCTWVLAPRERCIDVSSSGGCSTQAGGP